MIGDKFVFSCHGTMAVVFGFSGNNGSTQNSTLDTTAQHFIGQRTQQPQHGEKVGGNSPSKSPTETWHPKNTPRKLRKSIGFFKTNLYNFSDWNHPKIFKKKSNQIYQASRRSNYNPSKRYAEWSPAKQCHWCCVVCYQNVVKHRATTCRSRANPEDKKLLKTTPPRRQSIASLPPVSWQSKGT